MKSIWMKLNLFFDNTSKNDHLIGRIRLEMIGNINDIPSDFPSGYQIIKYEDCPGDLQNFLVNQDFMNVWIMNPIIQLEDIKNPHYLDNFDFYIEICR